MLTACARSDKKNMRTTQTYINTLIIVHDFLCLCMNSSPTVLYAGWISSVGF